MKFNLFAAAFGSMFLAVCTSLTVNAADAADKAKVPVHEASAAQSAVSVPAVAVQKEVALNPGVTVELGKKWYAEDLVNGILLNLPNIDKAKLKVQAVVMTEKVSGLMKEMGVLNEWCNFQCSKEFREDTAKFMKKEVDAMTYMGNMFLMLGKYPALKQVIQNPQVAAKTQAWTMEMIRPLMPAPASAAPVQK